MVRQGRPGKTVRAHRKPSFPVFIYIQGCGGATVAPLNSVWAASNLIGARSSSSSASPSASDQTDRQGNRRTSHCREWWSLRCKCEDTAIQDERADNDRADC